jgi:hypothetical protein
MVLPLPLALLRRWIAVEPGCALALAAQLLLPLPVVEGRVGQAAAAEAGSQPASIRDNRSYLWRGAAAQTGRGRCTGGLWACCCCCCCCCGRPRTPLAGACLAAPTGPEAPKPLAVGLRIGGTGDTGDAGGALGPGLGPAAVLGLGELGAM